MKKLVVGFVVLLALTLSACGQQKNKDTFENKDIKV